MTGSQAAMVLAALCALFCPGTAFSAIDPAILQQIVGDAQRLAFERQGRAGRWHVDPGRKACLLRDVDGAPPRLLFIRETGRISMWLAPSADALRPPPDAQPFQLVFVPIDGDPKSLVVNEFGASLWQEPLTNSAAPGLAIQLDPASLAAKYPAGVGIVLAQGGRTLFADLLMPDILAALPDFTRCRGGR